MGEKKSGMWGGRFEGGLDPAFAEFNRSLPFDQRLIGEDLGCGAAWASALGEAGVLTQEEVEVLVGGLEEILRDVIERPEQLGESDAEDVHSFVESALEAKVGPVARKLHTGRSRNDLVATDLKLYLRSAAHEMYEGLKQLMGALLTLAEETADLALPGYTHLQRAQPITAGHHALAYVEMFARDVGRLDDAVERMDTSPLGCGALAGTSFPIDREALARELGFEGGPARNSIDAVSDRDHALELAFASSLILVHLSRLAEDWIFLASSEAGLLVFGDAVSTGSSLMPQKRNPDAMELLRGKAGRVIGALQALLVTVKGLPLAYDKDLQEDKEVLFDALDTTLACLGVAALAVRHAHYDRDACRAACETGFLDATDLAELLVAQGVAFRDAHERVGAAVREALEAGVELRGLPADRRRALFPELGRDLSEALSLESLLARRNAIGGTAPERVRAELADWKERLESW